MLTYLLPALDVWSQVWSVNQPTESSLQQQLRQVEAEKVIEQREAAARFSQVQNAMYRMAKR